MDDSQTTLQDLRGEIDAIDAELHGLIKRRADLVEHIRAVKARDSITTVRPGREALILRTLARRHDSGFPFAAVARIWREIIAGITRMESPEYAVAVLNPGEDRNLWDLARDQFGSATPMTGFASAREVLGEVSDGRATIGVLPCPDEGDGDPWWVNLAVRDGLRACYRLPFSPPNGVNSGGNGAQALAIGRIVPDPTGNDRSLIVVETHESVSRDGLGALMEKIGLAGRQLASCNAGAWFYLIEADEFMADDDSRIEEFARLEGVDRAILVGAYAAPIDPSQVAARPS